MINDFGLNQEETAKKLNISNTAVSQYRCNKRANMKIKNRSILNEIRISIEKIINNGNDVLNTEICKLCKMIYKNNPF